MKVERVKYDMEFFLQSVKYFVNTVEKYIRQVVGLLLILLLSSKVLAYNFNENNFMHDATLGSQAKSAKRTIHVAKAGTLPNLISESEKYNIEELVLTGELNGTDFRLLRDMTGNNYKGEITKGMLKILDITDVKVVVGGGRYLDTENIDRSDGGGYGGPYHYSITKANELPLYLFTCCNLTAIKIPNTVTAIAPLVFSDCSNLSSVVIPTSVISIGWSVFERCESLTSISIPYSVTSIDNFVFQGCKNLSSINVDSNNPNYQSVSGVLFNKRGTTLIAYPGGKKDSHYTIPNNVTTIGANSFALCENLVSITIPYSVTSIEEWAFSQCGLSSILIPNSITSIGVGAFADCHSLTSVIIPNSVTSLEASVFRGCFRLSSVTIPSSVTSIGSYAFSDIYYLNSVTSEIQDPFEIGEDVFSFASSNAILIVPKGTKSKYKAFSGWTKNFKEIVEIGNNWNLIISSYGNGSVTYNGKTIRGGSQTFNVDDGSSAVLTIAPDYGYKIKSLTINNTDVTSNVSNSSYTIRNISMDTIVEVEFEAIPPTTYTLSIKVTGNGSTSYSGTTIRRKTTTFTVNEGTNVTITFSPDNGYRIKSVKVNNVDVTSSVSNNSYTISNIGRNTTVEVEFEAIPTTTYSLSIKATGNGSASYNGTTVRDKTSTFTVNEGTNATITFTPDNGYRIRSLVVNSADVTSYISSNAYTISNIAKNTTLVVEFEGETTAFTINGVNYAITSSNEKTVSVSKGIYGDVLEIPAMVTYQNTNWKVTGIESDALANSSDLCAIIWNPEAAFTESISNPNLLLYVKAASYAPNTIKNVIVNGTANSIILTDAESGNNFYCPQEFTARSVSYTHHYKMETGMGEAKGWETIALPFDVQKVKHQSKDEIVMFANWNSGDSKKPFWLMQYGNSGWTDANSIKAYTPYIISMPNHTKYKEEYKLNGNVSFSAENVKIRKTENLSTSYSNGKTFIPNFTLQTDKSYYALNVNNDYIIYNGNIPKGSLFYPGLRDIHPFEAYMTTTSGARSIAIADDMTTTGIRDIMEMLDEQRDVRVYNLKGQLIKTEGCKALDQVKKMLPAGVYIVNGQKLIIK